MVKVLIVDDSAFVRRSLTTMLQQDPEIQVVGAASNGVEGVELAVKLDPDVITMDVEMPRMNGLDALAKIMVENPCPVIMVSSLTDKGAETTLKALELGALDYMPKLSSGSLPDLERVRKDLTAKVKALARRKAFVRLVHRRRTDAPPKPAAAPALGRAPMPSRPESAPPRPASMTVRPMDRTGRGAFEAVLIGVSTGGPPAVQKILSALPGNFPLPILIAQHMPAAFTGPFANRLNVQSAITVKEAAPSEPLRPGTAYICPGGKHLRVELRGGMPTAVVTEEPKEALYKPSANVLMETGGQALGRKALSVMLTGMGSDGVEGAKVLKAKGGYAVAQSERTCVVYGMPKAVVDAGLADEIVDLDDMAGVLCALAGA